MGMRGVMFCLLRISWTIGVPLALAQPASRPELVLQTGHTDQIASVALSRDGRWIASGGLDRTVLLWDAHSGLMARVLAAHPEAIKTVAFSPDGRMVASVDVLGNLRVSETATGQLVREIRWEGSGGSLFWTPDGSRIAVPNVSGEFQLWSPASGERTAPFPGFLLSPDLRFVFSMKSDVKTHGRLRRSYSIETFAVFREVATGAEHTFPVANPALGPPGIMPLGFTPDGKRFLAQAAATTEVWEVPSGRKLCTLVGAPEAVSSAAFSGDGRLVALVERNSAPGGKPAPETIRVWDTGSGQVVQTVADPEAPIGAVALGAGGDRLVTGSTAGTVRIWNLADGSERRTLSGRAHWTQNVAFSPTGKWLATGSQTAMRLWSAGTGRGSYSFTAPAGARIVSKGLFSGDALTLATAGAGPGGIQTWDVATGRLVGGVAVPGPLKLGSAVFSADGKRMATLGTETSLARGGTPILRPQLMQGFAEFNQKLQELHRKSGSNAAEYSKSVVSLYQESLKKMGIDPADPAGARQPAGATGRLLYGSTEIRVWDVGTRREVRSIADRTGLALSPDGRLLASTRYFGYSQGVVMLDLHSGREWELPNGLERLASQGDSFKNFTGVFGLEFSPDGSCLASTGTFVQLWTGREFGKVRLLVPHEKEMRAAAPSLGFQGNVLDAPPELQEQLNTRLAQNTRAGYLSVLSQAIAFSPDLKSIAAGFQDGSLCLWEVESGRNLRCWQPSGESIYSVAFSPDGKWLVAGVSGGAAHLLDAQADAGRLAATLLTRGTEWLVATPEGLFDGSPRAWSEIAWRLGPGQSGVAPVETFFSEFYYPGLLDDLFAGRRPKPARELAQVDRRLPQVQIVAAKPEPGGRSVTVQVEVISVGSGARDVRLFRNGSLVRLWKGIVLGKESGRTVLEAGVSIVAGANLLSAYSFNLDNVKSLDATTVVMGPENLRRRGVVHVLAVGVNRYANSAFDLKFAVPDARTLAADFQAAQQKLGRYERVEVALLLDAQATKANLLRALDELAARVQPEDVVVVHFAGHGIARGERFFLIPHDLGYSGPRQALGPSAVSEVLRHGVSDQELEQRFQKLDAGHLLLIIDACESGQALESAETRRGPLNSSGLAQLAYEKGMFILTAAQAYQAALEAEELGHGYLTYALAEEGLKSAAADREPRDGQVMAREWLDYAALRVPEMQRAALEAAREAGRNLVFLETAKDDAARAESLLQRPRVYYRRERDTEPLVVLAPGAP